MITLHRILGHCTKKMGAEWPEPLPLRLKYHLAPHDCQAILPEAVQPLCFSFSNILFMATQHFQSTPLSITTEKQDGRIIIEIQREKESIETPEPIKTSNSLRTGSALSGAATCSSYQKRGLSLISKDSYKSNACATGSDPSIRGAKDFSGESVDTQTPTLECAQLKGHESNKLGSQDAGFRMPQSHPKSLTAHDMAEKEFSRLRADIPKKIVTTDTQQQMMSEGSSEKKCGQAEAASFQHFFSISPYIDPLDPLQEARLQAIKIDSFVRQHNAFYQLVIPEDLFMQVAPPSEPKAVCDDTLL